MNLPAGYQSDTVTRLETNLDDLSPEIAGAVMERLFVAGALDVWLTPVQMKKNRPGVQLALLCEACAVEPLVEIILTETSAFGLRIETVMRLKLERRFEVVRTQFGDVTMKIGLKAGKIVQAAPEFESCRALSQRAKRPLRIIYQAALQAYHREAERTAGKTAAEGQPPPRRTRRARRSE